MQTIKKVYKILTLRERRKLIFLIPVIIINGFTSVIGIASIMPFLSVLADPKNIEKHKVISILYNYLDFQDINKFMIFLGLLTVSVIIISNFISAVTSWILIKFANMRNNSMAVRLFNKFLNLPYPFFLNVNTSKLSTNILAEVPSVVNGVIMPLLQIISSSVTALFIIGLLIYLDPLLSFITIAVLSGTYIFVYSYVSKNISRLGKEKIQYNNDKYRFVGEAFGGIKTTKFLHKEKYFTKKFNVPSKKQAEVITSTLLISQIPHYILETIAFGGIILITIYMLTLKMDLTAIIPTLGVLVFAAYKLMPSLQNFFKSISNIKYNVPALDLIYEELKDSEDKELSVILKSDGNGYEKLTFIDKLELKDISFGYKDSPLIFNKLNLKINHNAKVGIVGITGAGKTTLVDILLCLLNASSGHILIDDADINTANLQYFRNLIGYVPQDIFLVDDTVTRNIAFGIPDNKISMEKLINACKIADIHNFIENELPLRYNTKVGERGVRLSGGQKQRLGIARALYHDPEILIFDEATSALDGITEENIFKTILSSLKSKTIIMIAHRLSTLKSCDIIYMFEKGNIIAEGNYDYLMDNCPKFRAMAKESNHVFNI